jgi:hypothetical protein
MNYDNNDNRSSQYIPPARNSKRKYVRPVIGYFDVGEDGYMAVHKIPNRPENGKKFSGHDEPSAHQSLIFCHFSLRAI